MKSGSAITRSVTVVAAIYCVAALAPSYAADRTIDVNYTLTADETVDGVLTVASGVTVDLNGYNLTVQGLAGEGTLTAGMADLTAPDPNEERVSYTTGNGDLYGETRAINLFNNNYLRLVNSTNRVIIAAGNLPLAVTYDFGADSPKAVDMYKVYSGPYGDNKLRLRSPKSWTFEGSNDKESWAQLDSRDSETNWAYGVEARLYSFENTTAYRYYRITFTAATATDYLELVQLEYFSTMDANPSLSELHVNVPANIFETNSSVTILGGVRLVKDGDGEFVAAKAGQMYSGGNLVAAGTLKAEIGANQPFGTLGCEMIVGNGTTFDFNGSSDCWVYPFTLNGCTVANTGTNLGHSVSMLGGLTLTDDSRIVAVMESNIRGYDNEAVSVNLGGHLLTVTNCVTFRLVNADISAGSIRIEGSEGVTICNGIRAPSTSFDVSGEFGAYTDLGHDVSVSNLTLRSDSRTTLRSTGKAIISVYGRFTTETTDFPPVRMMDGSTLDLTAQQGTFNSASASTNANQFKLTFNAGATVTIDAEGRTFALGDCIVAWDQMPQNVTFLFDASTAAGGVAPIATERGLFYGYLSDAAEWAWWTGAANDGDLTNPGNWTCKNAGGDVIAGALPSGTTRVFLEGSLNIQVPTNTTLTCGVCVLANSILTADCDIRGLGTKLQVSENAEINLNGHRLYISSIALTGTCTVKGHDISHSYDLTTTTAANVSSPTTFAVNTKASNLFNNNYARGGMDKTKRVIVTDANLPLVVTYDFGEAKVVDAYRIWTGSMGGYSKRLPRIWKFEGSNDNNANWTPLDARHAEAEWPDANWHRTYSFANTTAYRYYRITFLEPQTNSDGYLELVQLEYFNLKPTQSELHIDTSAGGSTRLNLSGLALSGNLRLFLEGNGDVRFTKTGQTYVGGTEVCSGTLIPGINSDPVHLCDLFGEQGSEVVLRGNGSGNASAKSSLVDFAARFGYTGYKYVLAGGTLQNANGNLTELRLDADSYIKTTAGIGKGETGWIGSTNLLDPGYADLGGHELMVTVASQRKFGLSNATLENGSLYIKSGGWFMTTNTVVATNNFLIKINCAPDIGGPFAVRDYFQMNTSVDYNMGGHDIDVYGTFKTGSDGVFHGSTLHDGSTIDLSELTTPLNVIAPFNTASVNAKGVRTLSFEPGATLGVKLGARHVSPNTPVISWTAANKPDATVKFKSVDTGVKPSFIVMDDGLYVVNPGFLLMIR
ncbi:MAG: hypothetical protein IJR99_04670 [Kiritimatiellae bacterium]|nr:hypothetical protein [Kiritimatiellia bacterium]